LSQKRGFDYYHHSISFVHLALKGAGIQPANQSKQDFDGK
jgi:hypothetical protein